MVSESTPVSACSLERDGPKLTEISPDLSVQYSGFWITSIAKRNRGVRSSRLNSRWGKGEMMPYRTCGVHYRARAQSVSVRESPWRATKKMGFCIFNQGSCFEYIWLNRIFHFTVLIINHTHWINVIFVILLKCNFFCTVNELHDRCSILSLCSWYSFSM